MDPIKKALIGLLHHMDASGVDYVVLGDMENFPRIDTDFDIVVADLGQFVSALREFCRLNNYRLVRAHAHATGIRFDIVVDEHQYPPVILRGPDVQFFATWYIRKRVFSLEQLLARRVRSPAGIYIPRAADAFLQYLIRRIDKGELTESQGNYLSRLWSESAGEVMQALPMFFDSLQCQHIQSAAESGNWKAIIDHIPDLRLSLSRRAAFDWQRYLWIVRRIYHRLLWPSGLFVAFFGPDGSGKSTVIGGIQAALCDLFSGVSVTHLRPRIGARKNDYGGVVTDPHGRPPRGVFTSLLKLVYFCLDYFVGYWGYIWPAKVGGACVIFDRYFDDILADPLRYRFGAPLFFVKQFRRCIPNPDCCILLDAPGSVLQERKQEVSREESLRQRQAYLDLFSQLDRGVVVDASRDIQSVQAEVVRQLLDYLSRRTESRLEKAFPNEHE